MAYVEKNQTAALRTSDIRLVELPPPIWAADRIYTMGGVLSSSGTTSAPVRGPSVGVSSRP